LIFILAAGWCGRAVAAAADEPVWLLGNNFHTSIVLRAQDVPYRDEVTGDRQADELAIGWGANQYYRNGASFWNLLQALWPNRGAIQVIPVHGSITHRFPDSDVVLLRLTPEGLSTLVREINGSFALTPDHHRVLLGRGYYADSRFYLSREYFYFPYVCNSWIALKLQRAGVPFRLSGTVKADGLVRQAGKLGVVIQRHSGTLDNF